MRDEIFLDDMPTMAATILAAQLVGPFSVFEASCSLQRWLVVSSLPLLSSLCISLL
jgi:hypothetical protein